MPLTAHESCRNVGTEPTDSTLGHYLSGFAAESDPGEWQEWPGHLREGDPEWLGLSLDDSTPCWRGRLELGIEFEFGKDGILKPDSYRCIGAG